MNKEDLLAVYGEPVRILDHGHVRLVDVMGDDAAIVQAARVSYGAGTKAVSEDRALIRYLMRHKHMTPFEMCEVKLHIKLPIFVARQWIRHRTASVNEMSGRYSEMPEEFYVPDSGQVCVQSSVNKQGRAEPVDMGTAAETRTTMRMLNEEAFLSYQDMLKDSVARETARTVLPLSTYTEWYWKTDLRNLLGFLKLRLDTHAQYEIRVYAQAIADMVADWCPAAWEAFVDYDLKAVTFNREEVEFIRARIAADDLPVPTEASLVRDTSLSKREAVEFLAKLGVA
jgi:thymidylate synthase (FAD)